MTIELLALQAVTADPALLAASRPSSVAAGYDVSLADVARFEAAYRGTASDIARAQVESSAASPPSSILDSPAMRTFFGPLDRINLDARRLADETQTLAGDGELSPSQMVMLTVRCHEFLFHCQMTSNVANRTSDGVQQLFRQQT
jgi:hypothetical protein